ncbi:(Fe-S)-binding protein, partial [Candidatus Bathyarchaeota archaeon]|nr:(Fe-S)-binding protein [Candidatus Bathyarchaeota archaeon]
YSKEKAKEEIDKLIKGEPASIIKECITCVACNQYCEKGANPFDLINQRQEETGLFPVSDRALDFFSAAEIMPTEVIPGQPEKPVISLCTVGDLIPGLFEGQLFEGMTFLKGGEYFCKIGWVHAGKESPVRDGAQAVVEKLAEIKAEEIIFYHDDCYAMMATKVKEYGIDLPFKPIHIIEYLLNYLRDHKEQIKKLNMKIAYQQPCASRYTPWKDEWLDELFYLIGVERVKRKYDRMNALCCATPVVATDRERASSIKNRNIKDALDAGAEAIVFLCPICFLSLRRRTREAGLEPIPISNLCRLALGEKPSA